MIKKRNILGCLFWAGLSGLAAPGSAATNGAVLPPVNVPGAGLSLRLADFQPANPFAGQAVRVLSSEGPFTMELLTNAPLTVSNFLRYVEAGAYRNLMVHRSDPDFVIQAGAVGLRGNGLEYVPTFSAVTNEPGPSNLRGTVAMAKVAGDPHSATSQWFVNLSNNTALDTNNGGFTVFARVLGSGMSNVDKIAALPVHNKTNTYPFSLFGGLFAELPLKNYNTNQGTIYLSNLVLITNVSKLPCAISSDPAAFTAEVAGDKVRVEFRGFPSNPVTVSLHALDSASNTWVVSVPVRPPAQKFAGLLDRTNNTVPTLATLAVTPAGVFSGTLANRFGTARVSSSTLMQVFTFTNVNSGVLFRALGESVVYWYGHEDASFFALPYTNTNTAFTNTLVGDIMPAAYSGASNDLCPLAGKTVNAVLTQTNLSPRPVSGFLQFAFDKAGAVKINGGLPDGKSATGLSSIVLEPWSGDLRLPVALFARSGQTSSLTGTLSFVHGAEASNPPVTGSLKWVSGTNNSIFQVLGAVWSDPAKSNAMAGGTNTVSCTLRIPALPSPDQPVQWGPDNRPRLNPSNGVTLRVDPAKGAFSGTASLAVAGGKIVKTAYRGVLFSSVPPGMESGLRGAGLLVTNATGAPVPVKLLLP